jgi:hypothetical protein
MPNLASMHCLSSESHLFLEYSVNNVETACKVVSNIFDSLNLDLQFIVYDSGLIIFSIYSRMSYHGDKVKCRKPRPPTVAATADDPAAMAVNIPAGLVADGTAAVVADGPAAIDADGSAATGAEGAAAMSADGPAAMAGNFPVVTGADSPTAMGAKFPAVMGDKCPAVMGADGPAAVGNDLMPVVDDEEDFSSLLPYDMTGFESMFSTVLYIISIVSLLQNRNMGARRSLVGKNAVVWETLGFVVDKQI